MNKTKKFVYTILIAAVLMYAGFAAGRLLDIVQQNPGATLIICLDMRRIAILVVLTVVIGVVAVWCNKDDEDGADQAKQNKSN